jgi:thymidine kinase
MAKRREGKLEIITGPMFSGKSEELVKRLRRFKVAGLSVKVFNHAIDDRYGNKKISSHSKDQWKAIPLSKASDLLKKITKRTDVVVIDEVQFFDKEIKEGNGEKPKKR